MDLEHEKRLTAVEDRSKTNSHRLDKVEKRQDELCDLVSSVKVLAEREENVENDVKEIKSDVKGLAGKSGKRWDNLVDKVIMTIVGIIIGYIFCRLGFSS